MPSGRVGVCHLGVHGVRTRVVPRPALARGARHERSHRKALPARDGAGAPWARKHSARKREARAMPVFFALCRARGRAVCRHGAGCSIPPRYAARLDVPRGGMQHHPATATSSVRSPLPTFEMRQLARHDNGQNICPENILHISSILLVARMRTAEATAVCVGSIAFLMSLGAPRRAVAAATARLRPATPVCRRAAHAAAEMRALRGGAEEADRGYPGAAPRARAHASLRRFCVASRVCVVQYVCACAAARAERLPVCVCLQDTKTHMRATSLSLSLSLSYTYAAETWQQRCISEKIY